MNYFRLITSKNRWPVRFGPILALVLIVYMGVGCDSGGSSHHHDDDRSPALTISQPTEADTYTTGEASITIGGSASDDQGIEQVIWETDSGKSGEATGTTTWEAQIDLDPGSNRITVTAIDTAGNKSSETLSVTFSVATYTLSGTVTAASNTAIDSDVNDPNAPYESNDSAEEAQEMPTPATLGGYLNTPGTGAKGRSFAAGDKNDFFRVELLADERIVLNIAEPSLNADLDMYLYDATDLELIDTAIDRNARTESFEVPRAGVYLIQVAVYLGASNYTLTIGQVQSTEQRSDLRISRDFAPGEVIVEFTKSDQARANTARPLSCLGLTQKAGGCGRAGLFSIVPDADANFSVQSQTGGAAEPPILAGASMGAGTRKKLDTLYRIKKLRSRPDIAVAEPNDIHRAYKTPNDEHYPLQWHYSLLNLPDAWDISTGSKAVKVAVIDTGVIVNHPDLKDKITGDGYDFISDPERALDGDGIDGDPDDPGDSTQGGSSFHGTHVAGTVAAASNNKEGISGASWHTRIMAIRALGKGSVGTTYDIMQGIRYAVGLENDSGKTPDVPADILNLSMGGADFSQSEQDVLTKARDAGAIIIAAAGNSAEKAPSYPAAYDGVISVSAVGINADPAPYSNSGPSIDVAAPGGDFSTDLNADGYVDGVLSTDGDTSSGAIQYVYTFYQGTSMAAPHVSGVAALMKSVRPGLTPDGFDGFLQSFKIVKDLGASGRDDIYGYGIIDARKAVLVARDGSVPTVLNISPATLNLGTLAGKATLTATRVGSEALSVKSVSDDAEWLKVTQSETDERGLGTYTVAVNRKDLSEGIYNATITFVSSENTVNVPVNLRVSSTLLPPDAGFHYILLADSETDETVAQISVEGKEGEYEYRLTDIEAGEYRIYAGTDSDNDYSIGDPGEAIGAYLSTDQPKVLTLRSDRSGLDFVTEFKVNIPEGEDAGRAASIGRKDDKILKKRTP